MEGCCRPVELPGLAVSESRPGITPPTVRGKGDSAGIACSEPVFRARVTWAPKLRRADKEACGRPNRTPCLTLIPRGLPRAPMLPPRKYYTDFVHYSLRPYRLSSLFRPDIWHGCSSNSHGSAATSSGASRQNKYNGWEDVFRPAGEAASRYRHQAQPLISRNASVKLNFEFGNP